MNGMPTVAVHDLLIHPRDNDLIAGTHGRGVWILDDITPLQQLSKEVLDSESYLFENPIATEWEGISRGATRGHQLFIGRNPLSMSQTEPSNSPSEIQNTATINYYLKGKPENKPELEIISLHGIEKFTATVDDSTGINRYRWDIRFNPSERQRKNFIQLLESQFKQLKEQVGRDQKKSLDQLNIKFKKAKTANEFNSIRQQLTEEFGRFARGRGFFTRPLQGPAAGAGVYQVKLVVDGKTYTRILTIRQDPMLD